MLHEAEASLKASTRSMFGLGAVRLGLRPGTFLLTQIASFSKYISKARTKRLPLTTKRVGKGYYKGKGGRTEGWISSKGQFVRDKEMCTELVVPDLSTFKLKAYVGPGAKRNIRDAKVEV